NDLLEGNGRGLQDLERTGSSDVREALRRNLGHCQHLNESARSHHYRIRNLNRVQVANQNHESRHHNEANPDRQRSDLASITVPCEEPIRWRSVAAKPGRFLKMPPHSPLHCLTTAGMSRPFFRRWLLPILRQSIFRERPVMEPHADRPRECCPEIPPP